MIYPKDDESRKIGTRARQLVVSAFDADHWDFHELTGTDHGIDIQFELIEDDEYRNHGIRGQIKGTKMVTMMKTEATISKQVDIKLIAYALGSAEPFVLFLADTLEEKVYYLPIQDYFIANPGLYSKLDSGQSSMNVHIPLDNIVCKDDVDLQDIAKSRYILEAGKVKKMKGE